jgi:hypothetical protein
MKIKVPTLLGHVKLCSSFVVYMFTVFKNFIPGNDNEIDTFASQLIKIDP